MESVRQDQSAVSTPRLRRRYAGSLLLDPVLSQQNSSATSATAEPAFPGSASLLRVGLKCTAAKPPVKMGLLQLKTVQQWCCAAMA